MASISLPHRPAPSTVPFRFLDLPGEIRNKIYRCLLTPETTQHTDKEGYETSSLSLKLDVQILRVCRPIRHEAEYVLRANFFVKITFKVLIQEFMSALNAASIVVLKPEQVKSFQAHVLSYEIILPQVLRERARVCVIRFRDLKAFCSGIQYSTLSLTQHKDLFSHIVTLRDPYPKALVQKEPFLTESLQERLVTPYRSELRNLPHFTLKGITSKSLKIAAEKEIIRPPPTDPEGVLREVESLKAEGNLYFTRGDLYFRDGTGGASEYWNEALTKIQQVMKDDAYQSIRKKGGKEFLNRLTALSFDLSSNKAQDYLACMRYHKEDQGIMDKFGAKLSDAVFEAMCTPRKYPGTTWQPTNAQTAKLAYRKAVRCRIGGEPLMYSQAEEAIRQALSQMPNDAAIKKEAGLIAQWGIDIRCRM